MPLQVHGPGLRIRAQIQEDLGLSWLPEPFVTLAERHPTYLALAWPAIAPDLRTDLFIENLGQLEGLASRLLRDRIPVPDRRQWLVERGPGVDPGGLFAALRALEAGALRALVVAWGLREAMEGPAVGQEDDQPGPAPVSDEVLAAAMRIEEVDESASGVLARYLLDARPDLEDAVGEIGLAGLDEVLSTAALSLTRNFKDPVVATPERLRAEGLSVELLQEVHAVLREATTYRLPDMTLAAAFLLMALSGGGSPQVATAFEAS